MKIIETVCVCILSWIIFQILYSKILKFLIHTPVYAFMNGWDREMQNNLLTSSLYLVISSFIFSICIALIFTVILKVILRFERYFLKNDIQSYPFK